MMVEEYPNLVTADLCAEIVAKFEADPRRGPSTVGNAGQIDKIRSGTLLRVNHDMADWVPSVNAVYPSIKTALDRYAEKYAAVATLLARDPLVCKFPLIERVDPGQGFGWHYDQSYATAERAIAVLLYLNDVAVGGTTEFKHLPKRIQPRTGKVAMFPPFWTHLHQGVSPVSGPKYVMSFFWVSAASQPPPAESTPATKRDVGVLSRLFGR